GRLEVVDDLVGELIDAGGLDGGGSGDWLVLGSLLGSLWCRGFFGFDLGGLLGNFWFRRLFGLGLGGLGRGLGACLFLVFEDRLVGGGGLYGGVGRRSL